jgi:hypothetical protein
MALLQSEEAHKKTDIFGSAIIFSSCCLVFKYIVAGLLTESALKCTEGVSSLFTSLMLSQELGRCAFLFSAIYKFFCSLPRLSRRMVVKTVCYVPAFLSDCSYYMYMTVDSVTAASQNGA